MMFRTILLIPFMMSLLACGLFTQDEGESSPAVSGSAPQSPYVGDATLEEKIIKRNTIVRASMTSFSSEAVLVTDDLHDGTDNRYSAVFRFNLTVSEYLKGMGPSNIVAVWVDADSYETRDEAREDLDRALLRRDGQWDDREAVIFLYHGATGFGTVLDTQFQRDDHFILAFGDRYSHDDHYSLHSESNKVWLPTVSATSSTGDGQEFLLDVPSTTKTITLAALKELIGDVTNELNAGDGSQTYRECVDAKYRHLRNERNFPEVKGRQYTLWNTDQTVDSGQPAGTTLDRREIYDRYSASSTTSLSGVDSALFSIATSTATEDIDGDGELGNFEIVQLARPIPAGEYSFDLEEKGSGFSLCTFVVTDTWAVTVTPPEGTLHEFLFDPVDVGTPVAANSTNGVLSPASFTGANGATTTISSLAWEPSSTSSEAVAGSNGGQVKLEVTTASDPTDVLGDHMLDFIEPDGSVSLSLDVVDATVGTGSATSTLNWTVPPQPWENGDKLMIRIRKDPL